MIKKLKEPLLSGIPAWVLSLVVSFVPIALWEIAEFIQIPVAYDIVIIIVFVLIVTAACFFICRAHPKSVWYTPIICNAFIIFFIIKDALTWDEWTSLSEWFGMVGIVVLSVIAAIVGARISHRRIKQTS